jgi:hypothetical protein
MEGVSHKAELLQDVLDGGVLDSVVLLYYSINTV